MSIREANLVPDTTPAPPPGGPTSLLDIHQVSVWVGATPRTIRSWTEKGKFPAPIRGLGKLRWHPSILNNWARAGGSAPRRGRGRPRGEGK